MEIDSPLSSPGPGPEAPRSSGRRLPKSKTGCKTCKKRKIKCGEERPSCRNCQKHNVQCDFLRPNHAHTPSPAPQLGCAGGPDNLNMLDLELMLNYTTATYRTLSHDRLLQDFYKNTVPRIGLRCDYVMRSVLAVSALHLASYRPDKREVYISKALHYHQLASRTAMDLLRNATEESAEELFLFSVLTIYFALASPRRGDGTLLVGESSCPDWMPLLKGTTSILAINYAKAEAGPCACIFSHVRARFEFIYPPIGDPASQHQQPAPLDDDYDGGVAALEHLRTLVVSRAAQDEHVRENLATYTRAISLLGETNRCMAQPRFRDITDAFIWVAQIADDFLPLLQASTQEAIAIFAHFGVNLKLLENQWWLRGWADHLIERAYHILDDEHRLWIRWPIERIGWVVP